MSMQSLFHNDILDKETERKQYIWGNIFIIIFGICLYFVLSCNDFKNKKVVYELYQGGIKIDEICFDKRVGTQEINNIYYKRTNKECE
jgi:hypothetical protein